MGEEYGCLRRGYHNVIGERKHTSYAARLEGYIGQWVWPGGG